MTSTLKKTREDFPSGVDFSEVLYADTTILTGRNHKEPEKILHRIGHTSKVSGLSLNKKCAHLRINSNLRMKFSDGDKSRVKTAQLT